MNLEERQDDYDEPLDNENAVEIKNSYFLWSVSEFYLKHVYFYIFLLFLWKLYINVVSKKKKKFYMYLSF